MDEFARFLERALRQTLPGWEAQQRMMPRFPDGQVRDVTPPANARKSAVAVVIGSSPEPSVLLTLRSTRLGHHRGQLSFPGGRIEDGETASEAALRELWEEVGIARTHVRVLGKLSPFYTPPSNSAIEPVVMVCADRLECMLNYDEVEEAFWVSLEELLGSAVERIWELPYGTMIVPQWLVHPRVPLWGATAVILSELLVLYEGWLSQRATPSASTPTDQH
ncbi:MAG: coenzyme A pyrophosphatase [Candidatus Kapaibacterium sp.]|nr:MAG: coenzyme A pyrophosphatase [Candidatus Kapabacteria bacterium]